MDDCEVDTADLQAAFAARPSAKALPAGPGIRITEAFVRRRTSAE